MEKLSQIKVILRFSGADLPLDQVIAELPIKASRVVRRGERMDPRSSAEAKVNSWSFEIAIPNSIDLEEHLLALFKVMQPKELYADFIKKWDGFLVAIVKLGETTPCSFLDTLTLSELNGYGLSLDIDMYHT